MSGTQPLRPAGVPKHGVTALLLLLAAACGGSSGGSSPGGGTSPPVADFRADPTAGTAPLTVTFTDLSTGTVTAWQWTFGDGGGSTLQNPVHVYQNPGTYTVTLLVSGPDGSDASVLPGGIQVSTDSGCSAEDATQNRPAPPFKSEVYDFVPLTPDRSIGFYCVYSVRDTFDGSPGIGNNVGMFLFPLGGNQVLWFGAGYGDLSTAQGAALFDAKHDLALVDDVIRNCMGLDPLSTTLVFVAPHGHPDHINGGAFREARALGYAISDIYYHEADEPLILALPDLEPEDVALLRPLPGDPCTDVILSFDATPLGRIWFYRRTGHTPGALDLVIDVANDTSNRFVVRGSVETGTCSLPPGTQAAINPHGNIVLP